MLADDSLPARGLRELCALRAQCAALERAFVVEARRRGASWREVGALLDVTPQSAWKRYRVADPCPPRPRHVVDEVREFHALWRETESAQGDGV